MSTEAEQRARAAEVRRRLRGPERTVNVLPQVLARVEKRTAAKEARQRRRHIYQPSKQELRERVAELEGRLQGLTAPAFVHESKVLALACKHFGRTLDDLKSPQRWEPLAGQRQVTMWLLREVSSASLPRIGKVLGDRDHTTVLYGCRKIDRLVTTDRGHPLAQHALALKGRLLGVR